MVYNKSAKKGAIELSISTIVIIVLAMSMLIMGVILIKNIFAGATTSVDATNAGVKDQINQLFNNNNQKVVVALPNGQVEIKKGASETVSFGIRNTDTGVAGAEAFTYTVSASSVQSTCASALSMSQASQFVTLGASGSVSLVPGNDPAYKNIVIQPTSTAPLCMVQYDINVLKSGQPYATEQFIVNIIGS
jgi:hypothetical protein